jgi:hypothetical protein
MRANWIDFILQDETSILETNSVRLQNLPEMTMQICNADNAIVGTGMVDAERVLSVIRSQ